MSWKRNFTIFGGSFSGNSSCKRSGLQLFDREHVVNDFAVVVFDAELLSKFQQNWKIALRLQKY